MANPQPIALDAEAIAAVYVIDHNKTSDAKLQLATKEIQHRMDLVQIWNIQPGERILEIGCGTGDCTVTLAHVIGESGHVTAIDPAPPTYGSPITLGQAHAHLSASAVGPRMTFIQADPIAFLQSDTEHYTSAVLAHCIWYFSSPATLSNILAVLATRVDRICLAEYALTASDQRGLPHVLAALAHAPLECHKALSRSNVRTLLSPAAICVKATEVGLELIKAEIFTPNEGLLYGYWETEIVLSERFVEDVEAFVKGDRERAAIFAIRDCVGANRDKIKAKAEKVTTMDVWVSVFKQKSVL